LADGQRADGPRACGQPHGTGKRFTLPQVSTDPLARAPAVATPTAAGDFSLDAFLAGIGTRAFRFAEMGLRHREDALDAVQDAMMKMLQYRERPAAEWTPLFWSILRSRIVDVQRRSLFRLRWIAPASRSDDEAVDWRDDNTPDHGMPDPSRTHDGREAYAALTEAIRALPRRQREAFTLRILEECDVATTAHIMGCGEGAVKTHLSRARAALQHTLEDFR
jgi:RNA polymerase sigma factor (sigma-70 family)